MRDVLGDGYAVTLRHETASFLGARPDANAAAWTGGCRHPSDAPAARRNEGHYRRAVPGAAPIWRSVTSATTGAGPETGVMERMLVTMAIVRRTRPKRKGKNRWKSTGFAETAGAPLWTPPDRPVSQARSRSGRTPSPCSAMGRSPGLTRTPSPRPTSARAASSCSPSLST